MWGDVRLAGVERAKALAQTLSDVRLADGERARSPSLNPNKPEHSPKGILGPTLLRMYSSKSLGGI